MTQICRHPRSAHNIIATQFIHLRAKFAQQRERLSDSSRRSKDSDFCIGGGGGVDASGEGGAEGRNGFSGETVHDHANSGSLWR